MCFPGEMKEAKLDLSFLREEIIVRLLFTNRISLQNVCRHLHQNTIAVVYNTGLPPHLLKKNNNKLLLNLCNASPKRKPECSIF